MSEGNLDKLSQDLVKQLGLTGAAQGIGFTSLTSPPSLILPPGGVSLGNLADGLGTFLHAMFGLDGVPDEIVPDVLDDVYLTSLEFEPGEDAAGSTMILGLRLDEDIPLSADVGLGDALALSNPEVTIGRIGPLKTTRFEALGTLSLFGEPFIATASFPGKQFSARYAGTGISVKKLLKTVGLEFGGLKMKITGLEASVDGDAGSYDLMVDMADIPLPELPGTIRDCRVEISRTPAHTTGRLHLEAEVAGYAFALSAEAGSGKLLFNGESLPETRIRLGETLEKLLKEVAPGHQMPHMPKAVSSLAINRIAMSYDSDVGHVGFACEGMFDLGGHKVTLGLKKPATGDPEAFLDIGVNRFVLHLHKEEGSDIKVLAATYRPDPAHKLSLRDDLLGQVIHDQAILDLVPPISLTPEAAMFSRVSGATPKPVVVMGLTLSGASVDLTKLPLVGKMIPPGGATQTGIDKLQIVMATQTLEAPALEALKNTLDGSYDIPVPDCADDDDSPGLGKGFTFAGEINFGGAVQQLMIGGDASEPAKKDAGEDAGEGDAKADGGADGKSEDAAPQTSKDAAPSVDAKWISIKKSLGPLHVERIGVGYKEGELWVLPDASFSIAGLTIGLEGLAISSPLTAFEPHFHLQGLSLDYASGPVEIGGAFLRVDDPQGEAYYGAAVLKTEAMSLSALGSYADVGGDPSMFVYIDLDYPLGGPPFFFVTGLTAGFGYNRSLIVPPIDDLESFPFIALARGKQARPPAKGKGTNVAEQQGVLAGAMAGLQTYIHPEVGQSWLAAGVHFTSFEIVDAFALIAVAFGHKFEVHVLGSAVYSYPPGSNETGNPLTRIDVLVRAAYLPDEGTLEVRAKLADGSYVFDPDCHLTGSMAFKTWMKGTHKNDFVLTIGGYHPKFKVPAHYPNAERLAFNWKTSDQLSIKGGIYFAMTGNYLMAGGFLDASWDSGALSAGLKITADFLIRYKPFHYDASMSIDVHASVTIHFFGTHHLSVSLGADLHLWGPPFSGTASFDIWVASFSVSFGGGSDDAKSLPWAKFRESFLPDAAHLITLKPAAGLIEELKRYEMHSDFVVRKSDSDAARHWVINAKEFSLHLTTFVPLNTRDHFPKGEDAKHADPKDMVTTPDPKIGIVPMDLRNKEVRSRKCFFVQCEDEDVATTTANFRVIEQRAKQPAGLWGNTFELEPSGDATVDKALADYQLKPMHPIAVGSRAPVDRSALAFDTENMPIRTRWIDYDPMTGTDWATLGAKWGAVDPDVMDGGARETDARDAILDALLSPQDRKKITGGASADDYTIAKAKPKPKEANA